MGNAPTGATKTSIFNLRVGEEGWEQLKLITDPKHVLYEEDRIAIPIDENRVDEVADTGILNPLTVRRMPNGDLEIMAGRQRYKWAVAAKKKYPDRTIIVPIRLMTLKDHQALKASVVENAHRVEDSIVARGEKATRMVESGFTQEEICQLYGVEWRTVLNWMTVAGATEPVRQAVISGKISESKALAISRKPIEKQPELTEEACNTERPKPGRKKGDTRRRIKLVAIERDEGGFVIEHSATLSKADLGSVIEELDSILQEMD